jgi:SAM-dependent methyltransferase
MRKTPSVPQRQTPPNPLPSAHRLPSAWLETSETVLELPRQTVETTSVYQSAWLARALATIRPARHVDISASPTFAAVASAFVPVDYYEFEPLRLNLSSLRTGILDFDPLPFRTASIASISTAGILEYLDPGSSDLAAMSELARVIAPDGSLLLCLPLGHPTPSSAAVYTFGQVLDAFEDFELEEFSLISQTLPGGNPLKNPDPSLADRQEHGTGCFWLRRTLESAD